MDVPVITVREIKALMDSAAAIRLIDVREADEWDLCRIPGAELIALSEWPAAISEKLADRDEALVIHCHHGGRSARAAEYLIRNGYTNVKNLTGGIDAWSLEIDSSIPRY